jgi:diadenosine tetraphosphate (Ap4A) HIT family hydrolase
LVYQDEEFFAFHDIDNGSAKGHILVCTKEHIEDALQIKDK